MPNLLPAPKINIYVSYEKILSKSNFHLPKGSCIRNTTVKHNQS